MSRKIFPGNKIQLVPVVMRKNHFTVRAADLQRDVRSFVSYAVGCMFGRYSLDTEGLAYAGGEWDESNDSINSWNQCYEMILTVNILCCINNISNDHSVRKKKLFKFLISDIFSE